MSTWGGRVLLRWMPGLLPGLLLGLACAGLVRPAGAQPLADPWPATDGAARQPQDLPGWLCMQTVALPGPGLGQQVAVCRRAGARVSAELRLLQVDRASDGPPRVRELARLRDANQARLRLFTAEPACPAGATTACLAGLLLVDQRDESSCYGTQVWVLPAGRPVRSAGFINELRGGKDEAGACIGPWAQVGAMTGGAVVHLPGPLMLAGRDGALRGLDAGGVRYRIAAARPVLRRQVVVGQ